MEIILVLTFFIGTYLPGTEVFDIWMFVFWRNSEKKGKIRLTDNEAGIRLNYSWGSFECNYFKSSQKV